MDGPFNFKDQSVQYLVEKMIQQLKLLQNSGKVLDINKSLNVQVALMSKDFTEERQRFIQDLAAGRRSQKYRYGIIIKHFEVSAL